MKRFEYFTCSSSIICEENQETLDSLGSQGWELVCVDVMYGKLVFKRELEVEDE